MILAMKFTLALPLLLTFFSPAVADIEFTVPQAGAVVNANHVITAHWKDSGQAPRLSELTRYDLFLCAGGDTEASQEEVALLVKDGVFARGNSVSFKIDSAVGSNEANAYFLKMLSIGPEAAVTNFSPRFTLVEMSGSLPEHIARAIASVKDLYAPVAINRTSDAANLQKRQNVGAFTIPYPLQSDMLTKYAPMAKKPPSAIPAKSATPQFPTSAYSVARTFLPPPTVVTTITASETYSTHSLQNTAAAAPQPTADAKMKRWLDRWKD